MNNPVVCTCCKKPLTGGRDTFGAIDSPMCWTCHSDLLFYEGDPSPLAMWEGLQKAIVLEFPEDEQDARATAWAMSEPDGYKEV